MINQIERWFDELTRKQIQRGVHTSVRQLAADIRTFIELHNNKPKPFKWTKSADQILASVKRFCHKGADAQTGAFDPSSDIQHSAPPIVLAQKQDSFRSEKRASSKRGERKERESKWIPLPFLQS